MNNDYRMYLADASGVVAVLQPMSGAAAFYNGDKPKRLCGVTVESFQRHARKRGYEIWVGGYPVRRE